MPGYNSQRRGTARTSQFFLSLYYVYCLCVNVWCTAATGCQPTCGYTYIYIYIVYQSRQLAGCGLTRNSRNRKNYNNQKLIPDITKRYFTCTVVCAQTHHLTRYLDLPPQVTAHTHSGYFQHTWYSIRGQPLFYINCQCDYNISGIIVIFFGVVPSVSTKVGDM
jgi:hypothetical protein